MSGGVAAAVAVPVGIVVGVGIRSLLAGLRRGAIVRPGPIELATALSLAVSVGVCWPGGWWMPASLLAILGVAVSAVDLRHHRIPDALTYPAAILAAALLSVLHLTLALGDLGRALLAAVAFGCGFALLALLGDGMGWGDVKLVVTLAAVTGFHSWSAALLGLVISFVLAAVLAVAGIALRRMTRKSRIAFGPALAGGFWLALLASSVGVAP